MQIFFFFIPLHLTLMSVLHLNLSIQEKNKTQKRKKKMHLFNAWNHFSSGCSFAWSKAHIDKVVKSINQRKKIKFKINVIMQMTTTLAINLVINLKLLRGLLAIIATFKSIHHQGCCFMCSTLHKKSYFRLFSVNPNSVSLLYLLHFNRLLKTIYVNYWFLRIGYSWKEKS